MVILIAGATHTGKTALAQRILERYHIPYLSIDHLKMGLIRSGQTSLTVADDDKLTAYLWPIVREMVKTAIENEQNLVVEGCYIPFDWARDFDDCYLRQIRYYCLVMTKAYIERNLNNIRQYANVVENRLDDAGLSQDGLISENAENLRRCEEYGCRYVLIDGVYEMADTVFAELDSTLHRFSHTDSCG